MKIRDVKVAAVATGPWPSSVPEDYEWLLVHVETDEGISGLGETRGGPAMEKAVHEAKKRLVGEDPTNLNRIQRLELYMSVEARSAFDIACWDITGKALGVPVHRLMGGKLRDRVRIYADSGGPVGWGLGSSDPEAFARRAKNVLKKGFDAMKVDVDTPSHGRTGFDGSITDAEAALMERQVKAVRDVIGEEMPLAVDCHGKYSASAALKIAGKLGKYKLWWLEDPVPFHDIEGLAEVKANTNVPISAGEVFHTRFDFRELFEKGAVSMLGPDSITTGGLMEFRKVGEQADVYRVPVAPHNMTTPLATMATAHVCAALPTFVALEHHFQDFDWWDRLVKGGLVIRDGYITIPEKPGIGVELDEDEISNHLRRGSIFARSL